MRSKYKADKSVLIGILFVILVIGGIFLWYISNYGTANTPLANISKSFSLNKSFDGCPDFIFVNKITIDEDNHDFLSSWNDGSLILHPGYMGGVNVACHHGSDVGENLNYLYCSNLEYHKLNRFSDNSGKIVNENTNYTISMVLNPLGNWSVLSQLPITNYSKVADLRLVGRGYLISTGEVGIINCSTNQGSCIARNYSVVLMNCEKE